MNSVSMLRKLINSNGINKTRRKTLLSLLSSTRTIATTHGKQQHHPTIKVTQAKGEGIRVATKILKNEGGAASATSSTAAKTEGLEKMAQKSAFSTVLISAALASLVGSGGYFLLTESGHEKFNNFLKDNGYLTMPSAVSSSSSVPSKETFHSNIPGVNWFYDTFISSFTAPTRQKLLPDFPPEMVAANQIPRTLVIDLEDTICHLEWTAAYGWRTAKRPHLDSFLRAAALAGWEIVIFSSGIAGVAEPIAVQLDEKGMVSHKIFRESTTYTNGIRVKDLSLLNRDLKNVLAIDDDPQVLQWHSENSIFIKPFADARAQLDDTVLLDLIPLLEDFAMRDVPDVRVEIQKLKDKGMGDAVLGFKYETQDRIRARESKVNKGLGGLMRRNKQPVTSNKL